MSRVSEGGRTMAEVTLMRTTVSWTRRRVAGAMASLATTVLAACRTQAPTAPSGVAGSEQPVKAPSTNPAVVMWHPWDQHRKAIVDEIVERFQKQYPTIQIQQELVLLWQREAVDKLVAAFAGGVGPDVTMLYADYLPFFAENETLSPLDTYLRRDRVSRDTWYQADIDGCTLDGKTWLLPHVLPNMPWIIYTDKSHLETVGLDFDKEPPATWADFEEAARKLLVVEAGKLVRMGFFMAINSAPVFETWLGTRKLAAFSPDARKATFGDSGAVETLQWMVDFRNRVNGGKAIQDQIGSIARFPSPGQAQTNPSGNEAMIQGTIQYAELWVRLPEFRMGMFGVMPPVKGAEMALPHRQAWGVGMSNQSKVKDAAWLVVKKFTAEEDGGGYLQLRQNRLSPIRKMNEHPDYRKNNPYLDRFIKVLEARWTRPAAYVPDEVMRIYTNALNEVHNEQKNARQALTEAAAQAQAVLDQYWAARRR